MAAPQSLQIDSNELKYSDFAIKGVKICWEAGLDGHPLIHQAIFSP